LIYAVFCFVCLLLADPIVVRFVLKEIMKLTDKIHLLKIDFDIIIGPGKKIPRFVNVILIFGKKITLIDTGVKGSEKKIVEYIGRQKRDASEIETIILSHAHPDHIGSAAAIKKLTGCKILAHKLEKEWIENIETQCRLRPVPGFYHLVDTPTCIDEFISHNQMVQIEEGFTIKIMKTSGHSKGSLSMLFPGNNILFTADSIPLKNDIPNYDDYQELMDSLEVIKKISDINMMLTSWTSALVERSEIERLIEEGEEYMNHIDAVVKECYKEKNTTSLDYCKMAVSKLGLPPFIANLTVDKAFKSHLK